MTEFEIGYLVGVIDSEGSVMLKHDRGHNFPRPIISVTSTNKDVLDYLVSISGCGKVYDHPSEIRKQKNWKRAWILFWDSYGEVQMICELLRDRVIIKKAQVETMLEFIRVHESCSEWHNTRGATAKPIERGLQLLRQMHFLNRKGIISPGATELG